MRVATWNVNGIRAREAQFLAWVERDAPDVVCLQEIKANATQLSLALGTLGAYPSLWHGAGGYSGVSLHLAKARFPSPPVFSHPSFDHETRWVEAEVDDAALGGKLVVASTYVPNGGKDYGAKVKFLEAMIEHLRARVKSGAHVIVCGDLNVARSPIDVHPSQRDRDCIGQLDEERELFEQMLGVGLGDVQRDLHPENAQLFSWWPYWRNLRQKNVGWRLDYVLASHDLAERATSCDVLADVGTSDHAPVLATFT